MNLIESHIILKCLCNSIYFLVIILQSYQSNNSPATKYLQIMNHLQHYMVYKELPKELRLKIIASYEHGYHRRYFKELSILHTLSG